MNSSDIYTPDPIAGNADINLANKPSFMATCYLKIGKIPKATAILTLIVISLLVYWPVIFHDFQFEWDDQWVVLNQYTEKGLEAHNLWNILTEFYRGQYAPANELYYASIYNFFGYNPAWFHLGSLLLHLVNVSLVFIFMYRLQVMSGSAAGRAQGTAFITALLMALHPFLVESVAWISASKILIYVMFYLLGLIQYLKYLRHPTLRNYALVLSFFVLSFGGKEQAVIFPLCLLLLDHVTGRSLKSKQVWREKIVFFSLSLVFGILTLLSQRANGDGPLASESIHYPFYQNIAFGCYAFSEYLVKCFAPIKLLYLYPFPNQPGEQMPMRLWMYPVLIVLAVFLLRDFYRQKWIVFGIIFFVIHILLALHIIPMSRFTIVADRYVYLSSIGTFFIIALLLEHAFYKVSSKWSMVALIFYITVLGLYAGQRVKVWHDTASLKKELKDVIEKRTTYEQFKRNKLQ